MSKIGPHSPSNASAPQDNPASVKQGSFIWRFITNACTSLQNGFMRLVRAVASLSHLIGFTKPSAPNPLEGRVTVINQAEGLPPIPVENSRTPVAASPLPDRNPSPNIDPETQALLEEAERALLALEESQKKIASPLSSLLPSRKELFMTPEISESRSLSPLNEEKTEQETTIQDLKLNASQYILSTIDQQVSSLANSNTGKENIIDTYVKKISSVLQKAVTNLLSSNLEGTLQNAVVASQLVTELKDKITSKTKEEPEIEESEIYVDAQEEIMPEAFTQGNRQEILKAFHEDAKKGLIFILGEDRSQEIYAHPDAYIAHIAQLFEEKELSEKESEIYKQLIVYYLSRETQELDLSFFKEEDLQLAFYCFQKLKASLLLGSLESDISAIRTQLEIYFKQLQGGEGVIQDQLRRTLLNNAKTIIPQFISSLSELVSLKTTPYVDFFDKTLVANTFNSFIKSIEEAGTFSSTHSPENVSKKIQDTSLKIAEKITQNILPLLGLTPEKIAEFIENYQLSPGLETLVEKLDNVLFDLKTLYPGIPIEFSPESKAFIKKKLITLMLESMKSPGEKLPPTLIHSIQENLPAWQKQIAEVLQQLIETTVHKYYMDRLFATSIFPNMVDTLLSLHLEAFLKPSNLDTLSNSSWIYNTTYNPSKELFEILSQENAVSLLETYLKENMQQSLENAGIEDVEGEEPSFISVKTAEKARAMAEAFNIKNYIRSCYLSMHYSTTFNTALKDLIHANPTRNLSENISTALQEQIARFLPSPVHEELLKNIREEADVVGRQFAQEIHAMKGSLDQNLTEFKTEKVTPDKELIYYSLLNNFMEKVGKINLGWTIKGFMQYFPTIKSSLNTAILSSIEDYRKNPDALLKQLNSVMKGKKIEALVLKNGEDIKSSLKTFSLDHPDSLTEITKIRTSLDKLRLLNEGDEEREPSEKEEFNKLCLDLLKKCTTIQTFIRNSLTPRELGTTEINEGEQALANQYIQELKNTFQVDAITLDFEELGSMQSEIETLINTETVNTFTPAEVQEDKTSREKITLLLRKIAERLRSPSLSEENREALENMQKILENRLKNSPSLYAANEQVNKKIASEKEAIATKKQALQAKEEKIRSELNKPVVAEIKKIAQLSFSFLNHSLNTTINGTTRRAVNFLLPTQIRSPTNIEALVTKIYNDTLKNDLANTLFLERLVDSFDQE